MIYRKTFGTTSYTVGVGQGLFQKVKKEDDIQLTGLDKDLEHFGTLNVELTADHVPLGEILERLHSDETSGDKNNFIRLHAVSDNSASTISATLNVATLDLSNSNSSFQQHMSEISDVLFNFKSDSAPSPTSTTSSLLSSPSFSPSVVPEVTSFLNNNSLVNCDNQNKSLLTTASLSPQTASQHGYESNKASPQECNLCNKMFGNASALAKHRLTHSDERKYLCTVCHKAFKRQDHLNGHLLTHRNKKPFECTAGGCNKSYCDARSLRRHRENHHSSKDDKLVSPSSSVSSSVDLDDKSLGSDIFDSLRSPKPAKIGAEKERQSFKPENQNFNILEKYIRSDSKDSFSNNSGVVKPSTSQSVASIGREQEPNPNMVECTICSRRFKNIPALNGHMRLHGGYYRKENDKKQETRTFQQTEPMSNHTVSSNVKNLIEEKIIQKRKLEPVARQVSNCELRFQNISVPLCSTQTPCSTTLSSAAEPPFKRLNVKPISSVDNLVFPVLPQPDTSKLLANLLSKQTQIAGFLPAQPLPNVPLPNSKCLNPVKPNNTHVKFAHINNLLKVDKMHNKEPRLGAEYQTNIPNLEAMTTENKYGVVPHETLMWSPTSGQDLSSPQVETYLKFCSSSAVSAVLTPEEALQILNRNTGDIFRASQEVLSYPCSSNEHSKLGRSWTPDQVDMFYEALCKHKKNFLAISRDIPGKSSRDCVEFYYAWKNICREESQSFKTIISTIEDPEHNLSV